MQGKGIPLELFAQENMIYAQLHLQLLENKSCVLSKN